MEAADFSGWATRAGLKCTDGRTIMPDAFKHQDGVKVPLVWQHGHNEPGNVLGHAILENRPEGVYAYAYFNNTPPAQQAKALVQHEDIKFLSIFANQLVERSKNVLHGVIREVSLVLAGANPGAYIDNVSFAHGDGEIEIMDDQAVIYTGLELKHDDETEDQSEDSNDDSSEDSADDQADEGQESGESSDDDSEDDESGDENDDASMEQSDDVTAALAHAGETVRDVYDSLTPDQKEVVHFMIGAALQAAGQSAAHSDTSDEDSLNHQEGNEDMTRNVFDQTDTSSGDSAAHTLSHSDIESIVAAAKRGGSLKHAVEEYALQHNITNIDLLFPDAKAVAGTPEFDKRRTEWVSSVLNGARHTPFSRIKTQSANLTLAAARAKGYVKGNLKNEEFFAMQKRVTTPQTVYKKQSLDRDDVLDITDFDVVVWLKGEMRLMLEEELARAALFGDGRDVADEEKIIETNIRPIASDDELYTAQVYVNIDDANSTADEIIDAILQNRKYYKGSGTPDFYTTETYVTQMLMAKDTLGRRLYKDVVELASVLRVRSIIPVEAMEDEANLIGVIVNMQDYTFGADKGGEVSMFDDFDIDYNKQKYLIETRVCGALTKIRSALAIRKVAAADVLVLPAEPTFDPGTGTGGSLVINDTAGVIYTNADTQAVLTNIGGPYAVAAGATINVHAAPDTNYYFANNQQDDWSYTAN